MAEQNGRNAATARPKGNAAACGQVDRLTASLDFADHGCQGRAGNPFLDTPQHLLQPPGPHHDQPGRIDTEIEQSSTVQVARFPGSASILNHQDRPRPHRQNPGEQGKGKTCQRTGIAAFAADHLMQRTEL